MNYLKVKKIREEQEKAELRIIGILSVVVIGLAIIGLTTAVKWFGDVAGRAIDAQIEQNNKYIIEVSNVRTGN